MKEISILLIIVLIIGAILGFKIYTSQDNQITIGEDKTNVEISKEESKDYSREEMIQLMESYKNIDNYYCKYNNGSGEVIRKYKDDILVIESDENNNSIISYQNYKDNEKIVISREKDVALISTIDSSAMVSINKLYFQQFLDLIKDTTNYKYEFLSSEEFNNIKCAKSKVKAIDGSNSIVMWIDIETGFLVKSKLGDNSAVEYELKYNCITDKEIERPDLSKYQVTNVN